MYTLPSFGGRFATGQKGDGGGGGGACCFCCFEIGDFPAPGRPGEIRDTHSYDVYMRDSARRFLTLSPTKVVTRLNARHIVRSLQDKLAIYHLVG